MYRNETVFYPQDEMNTVLLPVTTGCSYNRCAFCSMYKNSTYEEVSFSDIKYELKNISELTERVYLIGADPLHIGYEKMLRILKEIQKQLPYCACVACYGAVKTLKTYTVEELKNLHEAGLNLIYVGFESGDGDVLERIRKGHTPEDEILVGQKLNAAKLQFNAIIMYGIAGKGQGKKNARRTAEVLNTMALHKIITMNLTLFSGTDMAKWTKDGQYVPSTREERVEELRELLLMLKPKKRVLFDTTHPTNILKILGYLPEEKDRLISELR